MNINHSLKKPNYFNSHFIVRLLIYSNSFISLNLIVIIIVIIFLIVLSDFLNKLNH